MTDLDKARGVVSDAHQDRIAAGEDFFESRARYYAIHDTI